MNKNLLFISWYTVFRRVSRFIQDAKVAHIAKVATLCAFLLQIKIARNIVWTTYPLKKLPKNGV